MAPGLLLERGARYYTGQGRFLSEEPERGKANLFEYAGDNAVMVSDLSGMGDCPGGDCGGGGYSNDSEATSGNGFDLFALFQAIVDFFTGGSTSAQPVGPPPAELAHIQSLVRQFGNTNQTLGIDHANVYTQGGILLVQEDEDEEDEFTLPANLEVSLRQLVGGDIPTAKFTNIDRRGEGIESAEWAFDKFVKANPEADVAPFNMRPNTKVPEISNYPGERAKFPNGTRVESRTSTSFPGEPTIAIKLPDGRRIRIRY